MKIEFENKINELQTQNRLPLVANEGQFGQLGVVLDIQCGGELDKEDNFRGFFL